MLRNKVKDLFHRRRSRKKAPTNSAKGKSKAKEAESVKEISGGEADSSDDEDEAYVVAVGCLKDLESMERSLAVSVRKALTLRFIVDDAFPDLTEYFDWCSFDLHQCVKAFREAEKDVGGAFF